MKNYIIYLLSIFAMSLLLACDRGGEFELGNNTLALTLSCSDITRADDPGVDNLNENKIVSLDCFFYAAGSDLDTDAKAKKTITSIDAIGQYTAYISFTEEEIEAIFGDLEGVTSSTCLIYVIANRPSTCYLPEGMPTINQLKELTITSDFQTYTEAQPSFVMDSKGDDVVTLTVNSNSTKTLSGNVVLRRTASKISFTISEFGLDVNNDEVTLDGQRYTPNYSGIYVIFNNCVNQSHIAPDVFTNSDIEERYCNIGTNSTNKIGMETTNGHAPCTLTMPFYSYPSDWSKTEEHDASISLVVPWKAVGVNGAQFVPYHYKVPINYDGDKLERNVHYKINVQISMLGTIDPEQAVVIEPSYVVFDCLDWNKDRIDVSVTEFHYLMVEQNSYVMNNVDEIEIPFWSSHECELTGISVTRPNLNTGKDETITSDYILEIRDGHIYYARELHNSFSHDDFDFAPYTITVTIKHKNTHNNETTPRSETITITQYPALYGYHDNNSDYVADNNSYNDNNDLGFTFVNGYTGTSAENGQGYFGVVQGTQTGTGVSSISMLVFSVSSVEGTDYVIGDPREEVVNTNFINEKHNGNNSIWVSAPYVGGANNRRLQNYYATYVDKYNEYNNTTANSGNIYNNRTDAAAGERTYKMIAPKFRISSGYCVMQSFSDVNNYYHYMKKRCASYQEDGYPAGRWRLPTIAEVEFIVDLSNKGKIPTLFNNTIKYWCAHGYVSVNNGSVNITHSAYVNGGASARCVYDDWYWGSDPVLTTETEKRVFTWGDVDRAQKQDAPAIKY